jgi:hypothetical protein
MFVMGNSVSVNHSFKTDEYHSDSGQRPCPYQFSATLVPEAFKTSNEYSII